MSRKQRVVVAMTLDQIATIAAALEMYGDVTDDLAECLSSVRMSVTLQRYLLDHAEMTS